MGESRSSRSDRQMKRLDATERDATTETTEVGKMDTLAPVKAEQKTNTTPKKEEGGKRR